MSSSFEIFQGTALCHKGPNWLRINCTINCETVVPLMNRFHIPSLCLHSNIDPSRFDVEKCETNEAIIEKIKLVHVPSRSIVSYLSPGKCWRLYHAQSQFQILSFFLSLCSGKPFYMFLCVFLLLVAVVVCENQEEVEKRGSFPGQVQADGWTVLSPMHPRESGEKNERDERIIWR